MTVCFKYILKCNLCRVVVKLNFQQPSEIILICIFAAQETFLIVYNIF